MTHKTILCVISGKIQLFHFHSHGNAADAANTRTASIRTRWCHAAAPEGGHIARHRPESVLGVSISRVRGARELSMIISRRRRPKTIISDNGTELGNNTISSWAAAAGVDRHYLALGFTICSRPACKSGSM